MLFIERPSCRNLGLLFGVTFVFVALQAEGAVPFPKQPKKAELIPPAAYRAPTFPDIPRPPKGRWWTKRRGCGHGNRMKTKRFDRRDRVEVSYECFDKKNRRNGPYTALFRNGSRESGVMRGGVENGWRTGHFNNGRKSFETPYVAGKRNGRERYWGRDGALINETTYTAGAKTGPARSVLGHGKAAVTERGYRIAGARHGVWFVTDPAGNVMARVTFNNGVVTSGHWWYPDGQRWAQADKRGKELFWTRYDRTGHAQVKASCEGYKLRQATGWLPGNSKVVVRRCGARAPAGCRPIKTTGHILTLLQPLDMCRRPLAVALWVYLRPPKPPIPANP
jgi:antitoxin component YwqK of YwqJK toxin-antitoxin module